MQALTQSWVRNVVVRDGSLAFELRPGMKQFLKDYSLRTGATMVWEGGARTSGRRVLDDDLTTCWQMTRQLLQRVSPMEGCIHLDAWDNTDQKTHYLGGLLSMLHPDTGLPLTLHWCLAETHPYAWEAQKQSHECAAAYVRAAKRAWLNGPSRLPPGEHELPLDWPQFCMSDNGTTALAINTALKMFSARCACHIAYICVRVLL